MPRGLPIIRVMSDPMLQMIYLLGAVISALGMLVFLRALSSYRENEIETYELIRNARMMRAEYVQRTQNDD